MILAALGALGWQRYLVYGALAVTAVTTLVGYGYYLGVQKLWDYQVEQSRAAVPIVVQQGKVTERVVTEYRDRVFRIKADTVIITKEITVYVPTARDPVLGLGWLLLHDSAASGTVPPPAGGADVTADGAPASEALKAVADNYGTCRITQARLVSLQDWLRFQYQTMNREPLGY